MNKEMPYVINQGVRIILPSMMPRLKQADTQALIALKNQESDWHGYDEVLPTIKIPCLLYAGEADGSWSEAVSDTRASG